MVAYDWCRYDASNPNASVLTRIKPSAVSMGAAAKLVGSLTAEHAGKSFALAYSGDVASVAAPLAQFAAASYDGYKPSVSEILFGVTAAIALGKTYPETAVENYATVFKRFALDGTMLDSEPIGEDAVLTFYDLFMGHDEAALADTQNLELLSLAEIDNGVPKWLVDAVADKFNTFFDGGD